MNLFSIVKAAVTTRQAAEYYGHKIHRNGMICCPFHHDHTPSMKVDARFYCFGCHVTGDVIDFVARLFSLTLYLAAQKLAADFGLDPHTPIGAILLAPKKQMADVSHCAALMIDCECLLKRWKERYAPGIDDVRWHDRFATACNALPQLGFLIDCLYSPDSAERNNTAESLTKDGTITLIDHFLKAHRSDQDDLCEAA